MYNSESLNEYIEDVNDIFTLTKKQVNYQDFTKTSKQAFEHSLIKCKKEAINVITEMLNDGADRGSMLEVISFIQEKTKEILTVYKIQDDLYKNQINKLNINSINDSTLAVNIKDFKLIYEL